MKVVGKLFRCTRWLSLQEAKDWIPRHRKNDFVIINNANGRFAVCRKIKSKEDFDFLKYTEMAIREDKKKYGDLDLLIRKLDDEDYGE